MRHLRNSPTLFGLVFLLLVTPVAFGGKKSASREMVSDRSLARAIDSAQPFVQQGFTIREEYWGGALGSETRKVVVQHLFKNNEYWFCAALSSTSMVSVHVYDENGNLADSEYWKKSRAAGVHVAPRRSGTYYIIVEADKSVKPEVLWAMIYAFR
ncbi:MAG: hypothetical protein QOD99_1320 [Chthoniobacter sp.]|jgi:hypothetical protein|nr:hypothetical protein [Chthoniobacter sp.]